MFFLLRYDELQTSIKNMRNSMKIRDIAKVMTGKSIFIMYPTLDYTREKIFAGQDRMFKI